MVSLEPFATPYEPILKESPNPSFSFTVKINRPPRRKSLGPIIKQLAPTAELVV